VRAYGVEVRPPLLDQDADFSQRVEHFHVEQLVPQLAGAAFDVAVLLKAARLDVGRLGAQAADLALHVSQCGHGTQDKLAF